MMIPKSVIVELKSAVSDSFRCKVAANSLDIDVSKKSIHRLEVNNIKPRDNWNIGLIVGASGSGKTTLGKKLFGENCFETKLDLTKPIINQFPESMSYDECANILNGVGLNAVTCWIRPAATLSNGQRARAEAALLMCDNSKEIICIDEWTSVVDRTVAKAMSVCIHKHAKKTGKKVILFSCHYDIIEWALPDWLIDCNKQSFHNRENDSFFFQPREKLNFTIKRVGSDTWKYFSKYHYLSERLPGGINYMFGLFVGDEQIGFQCFSNYTPKKPEHTHMILHSNRTVVHPDYNGLGLGIKLINETSKWMIQNIKGIKIKAKFSAAPVFRAMIKQTCWRFTGEKRTFGKLPRGGNMMRNGGFRENGIKTYTFDYIGER